MKLVLALALLAPLYAQETDARLAIAGDVTNPLSLTKADLAKMPRTSVTVKAEGSDEQTTYEGVLLFDILKEAGAPVGKQLMGKALATYVLAEAKDGYQVVYALPEFDPSFTDNKIIVADTVNGKPLFQYQGPFRLVVPSEKKGARSIRMLEKVTVVRLRK
ncbi:MAG TPA: molybdopterin-dependent oxidoreductase [Bryobacteraceae bacterium]|jgi:DMSO/TMAO reductase YedYZ molybdopterin-dependent catalytic subunit|nr:molybdopterin-dependent oxidoreductase [Bryobacteraceae bacterium]